MRGQENGDAKDCDESKYELPEYWQIGPLSTQFHMAGCMWLSYGSQVSF